MVFGIALILVGVIILWMLVKWGSRIDEMLFAIILFGALFGPILSGIFAIGDAVSPEHDASNSMSHHLVTHETSTPDNSNHPTYTPTRKPVN